MVCDMTIDARRRDRRLQVLPAVMRSHARLTYTQVWRWLSAPGCRERARRGRCFRTSRTCYALYQAFS